MISPPAAKAMLKLRLRVPVTQSAVRRIQPSIRATFGWRARMISLKRLCSL